MNWHAEKTLCAAGGILAGWLLGACLAGCGPIADQPELGSCAPAPHAAVCGERVTVTCACHVTPDDRCEAHGDVWCCLANWATPLADGGR